MGRQLSDDHMKMLNLSREWLRCLLPHVLSKVDRVGYGLLLPEDIARLMHSEGHLSKSRRLLSVPFVGKDVPSRQSEWSHPDCRIGLSALAYRYEGLRMMDFVQVMKNLCDMMDMEQVPGRQWEAGGGADGVT